MAKAELFQDMKILLGTLKLSDIPQVILLIPPPSGHVGSVAAHGMRTLTLPLSALVQSKKTQRASPWEGTNNDWSRGLPLNKHPIPYGREMHFQCIFFGQSAFEMHLKCISLLYGMTELCTFSCPESPLYRHWEHTVWCH